MAKTDPGSPPVLSPPTNKRTGKKKGAARPTSRPPPGLDVAAAAPRIDPPPPKMRTKKKNDAAASQFPPPSGSDASKAAPLPSPVPNSAPAAPTIDSTPPKKRIDEKNDAAPSPFRPPPGSDASKTAPLPSPVQKRADWWARAANKRAIRSVTDLARLRLRRRIQKIYQMATDVVDGYGNEYYNKHDKPLPQEVIDKIMLLYHNRIERRCREIGITVEEEEQWDIEASQIDPDDLSDSGEESEEHDSDDVVFYSGMDDDDDEDDDDDDDNEKVDAYEYKDGRERFGDNHDARQIWKWEQEIKNLRLNLESDLVILQRMTHSPNRKDPYKRFDEWSAWKKNDVESKVEALNKKILELQESMAAKASAKGASGVNANDTNAGKASAGRKRKSK